MTDERISLADTPDRDAAIARAEALLRRDGVVVLDDVVDPALAQRCLAQIKAVHPEFETVDVERNYGPYPLRHTTPIVIADALAERDILLPRPVAQLANRLLGTGFEIDSYGVLVSLPGAPTQKAHPDALLFGETLIDRMIPPFALALAVPLVPMDAVSGTTAFWRGSHRKPATAGEHDLAPLMPVGSALLWDFRVVHRGLANRGERSRPVLFSVLGRAWYSDIQPPEATRYARLQVARETLAGFNPGLQRRLRRARVVA